MISIFDLFSIGIGPSSSHTVGPMSAAKAFVAELTEKHSTNFTYVTVEIFGSLAYTGVGHGTDKAILMGLEGEAPDSVNPDEINQRVTQIKQTQQININQLKLIKFNPELHFIFNKQDQLPYHTNAMRFKAYDANSKLVLESVYYSIGGGFILKDGEQDIEKNNHQASPIPYPFNTMKELRSQCEKNKISIAKIMLANESVLHGEQVVKKRLLEIFNTMKACIQKGCQTEGILPGGLNVRRRAHDLLTMLEKQGKPENYQHIDSMNWLNMYAIAVNEENAAGGRVVTAPTNGAAGIIPAVLNFYAEFYPDCTEQKILEFLLTAGAIVILYKKNASISGAEVGCQGEVGVAASMAAGALAAVLGGNIGQIENAAEIAMEHHLGMTCDPIAGLVQIPCIERNAMGAIKAVNAVRLAMAGDGTNFKITLDEAIITMKRTGDDMSNIYKETSLGGLAATHVGC